MDTDAISDDLKDKAYALFNSNTPDVQGVSLLDFQAVTGLLGAKIRELVAAQ